MFVMQINHLFDVKKKKKKKFFLHDYLLQSGICQRLVTILVWMHHYFLWKAKHPHQLCMKCTIFQDNINYMLIYFYGGGSHTPRAM